LNDELVYGEAGAYNQSFMLGGSGSLWLYEHATESVHCVATLFYWGHQGGSQKFVWLAETEFDGTGAQQ
jgi:hypothetical protein